MIGFVDESMREGLAGLYVVAAVVVAEDLDEARTAARSVLLPRQERFHWHEESEPQRRKMLGKLPTMATKAAAYVYRPVTVRQQERARALCLNRLLWDLHDLDVDELVLESRQRRNDQRDRQTIVRAQKAERAPAQLRYRFDRPSSEPLLWLPDAVAGAVATDLTAGEAGYREALGTWVSITDIDP